MQNKHDIRPGCFWYDAYQQWGPANVKWCEATRCSAITEPVNTWSNLSYIILGIVMLMLAVRSGKAIMRIFGPASIITGIFSGIYHASNNFLTQFGDFFAMYVFVAIPMVLNMRRLGKVNENNQYLWYLVWVVALSAITPVVHFSKIIPIQALVLFCVIFVIVTEFMLYKRARTKPQYKFFIGSIFFITAGAGFSALDVTRTLCMPYSIIQGHAMWHCLSAISLFVLYHFYNQFNFSELD